MSQDRWSKQPHFRDEKTEAPRRIRFSRIFNSTTLSYSQSGNAILVTQLPSSFPNTALFKTPGIFLILFWVQTPPYLRYRSHSHSSLRQAGFNSVVLGVCVQTSVLSCVSPRLTAVRVGLLNEVLANLTAGNYGNYCVNLVSGPVRIVCFLQ